MKPKNSRLAWSSEAPVSKALKEKDRKPAAGEPRESLLPWTQQVRVRRETGGRGGKTVTVAGPLVLTREDATALLSSWKKLCGSGGALKTARMADGAPCFELEIQGDQAERLVAELLKAGYKAKRSGG